jgi:hypothetical protein
MYWYLETAFQFDSYMVPETDLLKGELRLLKTDNALILPQSTPITLIITSEDVLHSWSVQRFGIKVDAVPGRLSQASLLVEVAGIYYGQCSELCGVNHGFMPIEVWVVDSEFFFNNLAILAPSEEYVSGLLKPVPMNPTAAGLENLDGEPIQKDDNKEFGCKDKEFGCRVVCCHKYCQLLNDIVGPRHNCGRGIEDYHNALRTLSAKECRVTAGRIECGVTVIDNQTLEMTMKPIYKGLYRGLLYDKK